MEGGQDATRPTSTNSAQPSHVRSGVGWGVNHQPTCKSQSSMLGVRAAQRCSPCGPLHTHNTAQRGTAWQQPEAGRRLWETAPESCLPSFECSKQASRHGATQGAATEAPDDAPNPALLWTLNPYNCTGGSLQSSCGGHPCVRGQRHGRKTGS